MHFNSWIFVFGFLPLTLIGYYALKSQASPALAKAWLGIMSLVFYAWWSVAYLLLLLCAVVANFYAAQLISMQPRGRSRTLITAAAICGNLALLGYFKYTNFFLGIVDSTFGFSLTVPGLILPLGISFFTFQKIAYLADVHQGLPAEKNWNNFLLFVAFFPQLIAGPIVHNQEVLPQFAHTQRGSLQWSDIAVGLALFGIGLCKKTMLADPIATYASLVFEAAAKGVPLTQSEAWLGSFAYAFQIYFDFSGYSDMAIGLARMFGIKLPLNFASPYQSTSIIDFWHRWHMTLSRFLRDYVYIPLGGNRRGPTRRYINLMTVMLVGGLWHGAGWSFVVWGGLHGLYLLVNHAWRALGEHHAALRWPENIAAQLVAWATTFVAVVVAWVFFRAATLPVALNIVGAMFDPGAGLGLRSSVAQEPQAALLLLVLLGALAFLAPNSQMLLRHFEPAYGWNTRPHRPYRFEAWLAWRPSLGWALFTAACLASSIMSFSNVGEFIYFNF